MTLFRHILWGYELTYPDDWSHQAFRDADTFTEPSVDLEQADLETEAGQLVVRGEWNWSRQPLGPLWNEHMGKLASMMGAKHVGSAPWRIRNAVGREAEIVLPKKDNRRLWVGILTHDFRVIHFMVTHSKDRRGQFEPVVTKVISSLRFPGRIMGIKTNRDGLPLPPDYTLVDPKSILSDISDPEQWTAYSGKSDIGALQAFYLRELPVHNWEVEEYVPFPGPSHELGFARLRLRRDTLRLMLGLMPYTETEAIGSSIPANIVFKRA